MSTVHSAFCVLILASFTAFGCGSKSKTGATTPANDNSRTRAGGKSAAPEKGAEITAVDGAGQLRTSPVYFEYDSAVIEADYRGQLSEIARRMAKQPDLRLTIEGHCDERGTEEYNIALGERRARAIRGFLVRAGAPEPQLDIISYGETRPAVAGNDDDAMSRNRRGELIRK